MTMPPGGNDATPSAATAEPVAIPRTARGTLRAWFRRAAPMPSSADTQRARETNPLMAFAAEDTPEPARVQLEPRETPAPRQLRLPPPGVTFGIIAVSAAIAAATLLYTRWDRLLAAERQQGKLTVDTRPAGAAVLIDGLERGKTPLALSLEPGAHRLTLRRGAEERVVPFTLAAGAELGQYVEFTPAATPPIGGRMSIA